MLYLVTLTDKHCVDRVLLGLFTSLVSLAFQRSFAVIGNYQERLPAFQDHRNTLWHSLRKSKVCQKLASGLKSADLVC